MKTFSRLSRTALLAAALGTAAAFTLPVAYAQQGGHNGMNHGGMNHGASEQASVQAMGTVKKVLADKRMIKLKHDPIPALGWPTMTMNFNVAEGVDLGGYHKDQAVHFSLSRQADGSYLITELMGMQGMKH